MVHNMESSRERGSVEREIDTGHTMFHRRARVLAGHESVENSRNVVVVTLL